MIKLERGIWIALEGGDGCGKTTQTALLASSLTEHGYDVIQTREPGGTPHGENLRKSIFDPAISQKPKTQLYEFVAARSETVSEIIIPALEARQIIVADRSEGSTFAYQHFQFGLPWKEVKMHNDYLTEGLRPDLTIYLDVDPEIGVLRVKQAKGEDANYFDNVNRAGIEARRRGYQHLVKNWRRLKLNPWIEVDANQPLEIVQANLLKSVAQHFPILTLAP